MIVAKTGNEAMAYAMKQINPDVVAAYPITPSTEIVQIFSSFVADGLVDTEYVAVESEHSAMSACIGAAVAGARAMTATASQGLALMHEMLFIASGLRLPIVMCVASRSLSSPLNIHCDHSDSVASRDAGWIQIFCENSQEGYDSVIQAVKIAETCYLPVMVAIDGFILSHCMDRIEVLEDEQVQKFIGKLKPNYSLLDVKNPITVSPACLPDSYFEHKRAQAQGMNDALPIIEKVIADFAQAFGRNYPVLEGYRTDDAEVVVLVMGSTVGTARIAVDEMRLKGEKVGMVKLRFFRPLVYQRMKERLGRFKVVGVLDRVESVNSYVSPLATEVRACLYDVNPCPLVPSYVYGLGGREITPDDIMAVFDELLAMNKKGKMKDEVTYVGVR
jgi:pyruvate ferredoxin oxidoreductase alpha subunit|uniref:Pyruvate ferredoxin oxidoreductase n=1 Tax=candidate division WOR-3 bacterium TaxID=2052148 RepID=A0A7C6EH97_UNCW3